MVSKSGTLDMLVYRCRFDGEVAVCCGGLPLLSLYVSAQFAPLLAVRNFDGLLGARRLWEGSLMARGLGSECREALW